MKRLISMYNGLWIIGNRYYTSQQNNCFVKSPYRPGKWDSRHPSGRRFPLPLINFGRKHIPSLPKGMTMDAKLFSQDFKQTKEDQTVIPKSLPQKSFLQAPQPSLPRISMICNFVDLGAAVHSNSHCSQSYKWIMSSLFSQIPYCRCRCLDLGP